MQVKNARKRGCGKFLKYPDRETPYASLFKLISFFLVFGLAACDGGGSNESSGKSSDSGNSDPKDTLVFQEISAFPGGVSSGFGIALSPDGDNLYFTMLVNNRLGRFQRNNSGSLTFDRYWIDNAGGVNGLGGAFDLVASPDGQHLYVTGSSDNALAIFNLDATGDLDFSQVLVDGSGGIDGLNEVSGLDISSDGNHVYVAGYEDDSVTFFTRNAGTGALTAVTVFKDGSGGVDGLDGAISLVLSPDGKNLYVTGSTDDALAVFNRNTGTGALTFVTFLKDASDDGSGNVVDGLNGARNLVVSPDGKNLYVTGSNDNALAVFSRDATTGALTFEKAFRNGSDGLENFLTPEYLALSADGKNLYVSAYASNSLAVFDRNTATGELTFRQSITRSDLAAMDGPRGQVLSSDGKTIYVAARTGILRFSWELR